MAMGNEVQSWAGPQGHLIVGDLAGRSSARETGRDGVLRSRSDLPPEIAAVVDNFERSSFRLTYAIIGFAGAVLVLTFLIAYGMILVAGK